MSKPNGAFIEVDFERFLKLETDRDGLTAKLDEALARIDALEARERAREETARQMEAQLKQAFEVGGPLGMAKTLFRRVTGKTDGEARS